MNELSKIDDHLCVTDNWSFPVDTFDLHTVTNFESIDVPPSMARCIVRTDTNQVLGVHGSKYKAIKHDNVVNSVFDAVAGANISHDYTSSIEVFDNGAKMRGVITFNDLVVEPVKDDYIKFQIKFFNSYDSSWAFQQLAQGLRLWCLNGCTTADTVATTWAKHTTNVNVKGSAAKIHAGLESFLNTPEMYKQWMNVHVSDDLAEAFFKATLCKVQTNTSEQKFNMIQLDTLMSYWKGEAKSLGANKWALYNACTYWATHTDSNKSPANTQRLRENALSKAFKTSAWQTV